MKNPLSGTRLRKEGAWCQADSFYEWKRTDKNKKQAFRIFLKGGKAFYFAGVYDKWVDSQQNEINSFSILTTEPNAFMQEYSQPNARHFTRKLCLCLVGPDCFRNRLEIIA